MAQKSSARDMSTGNLYGQILRFAFFVFLSQLFQQLYNAADSVIVGNCLGKEALAAVSSSSNLIFLLIGFVSGTAMGAGVVISRYFGAGQYSRMSRAIHTIVLLGLLAGILLAVVGVAASPWILRLMGVTPEVLPNSIAYFRFYFIGAPAVLLYNVFTGILNAVGDSKYPLYYLILSSVLNVLLDLLFLAVFHLGVGSAAVATTIAQTVSALLCLFHLMRPGTVYELRLRDLKIWPGSLREILWNGLPTGVQNSVIGLANVIVQSSINAFGTNAMAACGSFDKIEGFVFLPVTSFSMAMATFVGQNLGAGRPERIRRGSRFGIALSMLLSELFGVLLYFRFPLFIGLFSRDPAVVALGTLECRTLAPFFFLLAFSHCVAGVCRGAGKAFVPMCVMLTAWCLIRTAYIAYVTHALREIVFLFWAYPLTWGLSSIAFLLYYLTAFRKSLHALSEPEKNAVP